MTVSINTKNEASITPRTVLTDFISDLSGCTTMTTKILRTLKASSTAHMERQCLHSTLKRNNNRNSRKKAIESSCKVFYRVPADGLGGSLLNRRFWPSFRSPRTDIVAKFLDAEGNIPNDVMSNALHPGPKEYETWAEAVKETLTNLMK